MMNDIWLMMSDAAKGNLETPLMSEHAVDGKSEVQQKTYALVE